MAFWKQMLPVRALVTVVDKSTLLLHKAAATYDKSQRAGEDEVNLIQNCLHLYNLQVLKSSFYTGLGRLLIHLYEWNKQLESDTMRENRQIKHSHDQVA